ncbi:hypothetical protein [Arthrobacter sp. NEB 688]|uniref:hypothetical protein n=1 Tax=Arthrobacter sp. NEB 688 TaxID=904039 RepID=UPI001564B748|nr:hypothetical protein [Arthrobacter sp. NEB 688]QKE85158.1 hypothetical protein HL663_15250 [Arthrobacter sp. NEB 688]
MGIWGAGIFSDDLAEDVREEYRQLVGDGVPSAEATRRVLQEFLEEPEDGPVVWLALAATQTALGRLEDEVKARAVELIDGGTALGPWRDGPASELRARKAALARLRGRLVGPQPEPKKVRREWRPDTTLAAGDVLAWRSKDGRARLLRVVTIEKARNGTWPILELLAGLWDEVPSHEFINALPAASISRFGGGPSNNGSPRRWTAYPFHYGEPGWEKSGFTRITTIDPRPGDERARSREDMPWPHLVKQLQELEGDGIASA